MSTLFEFKSLNPMKVPLRFDLLISHKIYNDDQVQVHGQKALTIHQKGTTHTCTTNILNMNKVINPFFHMKKGKPAQSKF